MERKEESFTVPSAPKPRDIVIDWSGEKVMRSSSGEVLSVVEAVQKGYIDSELVEKLAESGIETRNDININFDKGTIQDKVTMESMTIDEAVHREYINQETASVLKLICGEWKEEVTKHEESTMRRMMDLRKEDHEQTTTQTTQNVMSNFRKDHETSSQTNRSVSSTPMIEVLETTQSQTSKSMNEYIRSETFDSRSFIEAFNAGYIDTSESFVVNPYNTEVITLQKAIEQSVFDAETFQLVHIETGRRWSLEEAYEEGYIPTPGQTITRSMQSGFVTNNFQFLDEETDKHIHTTVQTNLKTSLTEPMIKPKGITFSEAVHKGLINEQAGTFYCEYSGEVMSVATAIQQGWISESGETVRVEPVRKYEKSILVNQVAPSDEIKRLSFTQALDQGFIDLSKGMYTEPGTGQRMSILDAIRGQLIETSSSEEMYVTDNMSLNVAIETGSFDEVTGMFVNRSTGEKMTLCDAIHRGFIDGNSSVYDVSSGKIYTLNEAIQKGKIDAVTGQYVESSTSRVSVKNAVKKGLIALIGAPYLAVKSVTSPKQKITHKEAVDIQTLNSKFNAQAKRETSLATSKAPVAISATKFSVLSPTTLEVTQVRELSSVTAKDSVKMNFMEAVSSGYMNPESGMFQNPDSGLYMNIRKAVEQDLIHPDSVKIQTSTGRYVNLKEALDIGLIDNTGHLKQDGGKTSLEDMIQDGLLQETIPEVHAATSLVMKTTDKINVHSVFDPRSDTLVSLSGALDTGLINPHDGTYTNPKTGEVINIMEALTLGYIQGDVIDSITMKEGLSKEGFKAEVTFSEKKNMKVATVLDMQTGDKVPLHEAIRKGIIDENEGQYKDLKTGESIGIQEALNQQYITASEVDAKMKSSESTEKTKEDTFSQTHSLNITTVIDPYTKETLNIQEAINRGVLNIEAGLIINTYTGREMTISEAIKQGYVQGSQTSRKSGLFADTLPKQYVHEKEITHITSVFDKKQRKFIPVKEAIERGIIDEKLGLYVSSDGTTMPISRAIREGLIESDQSVPPSDSSGVIEEKKSYTIHTVLDTPTGKRVSAAKAIEKGLLNLTTGIYFNPKTGEHLTIPEAVDRGFVEAETGLTSSQARTVLKPASFQLDVGQKAYTVKSVKDPWTKEDISVTEAVSRGILDQSMCKYLDKKTGQTLTMREAAQKGLVIVEEVKDTPYVTEVRQGSYTIHSIADPLTGKEYNPKKAIDKGLFDPNRGLVLNRLNGKWITLDDAVKQGLATIEKQPGMTDQEIVRGIIVEKVKDPMTGKDLNIAEAKRRGILDSDSGHYVDHKTHTKMSVEDALKNELIKGRKTTDSLKSNVSSKTTDSFMSTKSSTKSSKDSHQPVGVRDTKQITLTQALDTRTGVEVHIQEAIHRGLVDKELTTYTEPRTGKSYSIEEAMKEGLVSGIVEMISAGKVQYNAPTLTTTYNIISVTDTAKGKQLSVTEAMSQGILGPSGMFVDTRTGNVMPVSDAIKAGMVETEVQGKKKQKYDKFYKIEAPGTELHVITFSQALKNNFINTVEGTFSDPFKNCVTSVDEAVLTSVLVSDDGKPFKYKAPRKDKVCYSLEQAFKSGVIDSETGLFWDSKKGKSYSVDEAMKKGYLSPLANPYAIDAGSVTIVKGALAKPLTLTNYTVSHEPSINDKRNEAIEDNIVQVQEQKPKSDLHVTFQTAPQTEIEEKKTSEDTHETTEQKDVVDCSHFQITLTEAVTAGLVDMTTGEYLDSKSGESMSVDEAVICGFLAMDKPDMSPLSDVQKSSQPPLSISDAVKDGHINSDTGTFTTPVGKVVSLQRAMKLGYIQPKISMDWDDDSEAESEDAENDSEIIPQVSKPSVKTSEYIVVVEGSPFSPKQEAVFEQGKLISTTATELVVTQGSATYVTRPGYFIDSTGKVVNSISGERMALAEAMQRGIVDIEAAEGTGEVKLVQPRIIPTQIDEHLELESMVRRLI